MGIKDLIKMNDEQPTPITDAATHSDWCGALAVEVETSQMLERDLYKAREQIASCAINTNVRLFDLVRYMRAPLHEDGLITDEEYFWLCGGCEMANSPKGGSPSPRRLEDYDVLSNQLKAMREAVKEATHHLQYIANANVASLSAKEAARHALAKLQPFLP